jgi:hypothetical protein
MEPRGCIGEYDPGTLRCTLYKSGSLYTRLGGYDAIAANG